MFVELDSAAEVLRAVRAGDALHHLVAGIGMRLREQEQQRVLKRKIDCR